MSDDTEQVDTLGAGGCETEIGLPVTQAAPELAWSTAPEEMPETPDHHSWSGVIVASAALVVAGVLLAGWAALGLSPVTEDVKAVTTKTQTTIPPAAPITGADGRQYCAPGHNADKGCLPVVAGEAAPTATAPTSAVPAGPHSAIADIDLPLGTEQVESPTGDVPTEYWRYTVPYADALKFLQDQFSTGARYDGAGATRWHGLAPCYDNAHHSPPMGSDAGERFGTQNDEVHEWAWFNGGTSTLYVQLSRNPKTSGNSIREDHLIIIENIPADVTTGVPCKRS